MTVKEIIKKLNHEKRKAENEAEEIDEMIEIFESGYNQGRIDTLCEVINYMKEFLEND